MHVFNSRDERHKKPFGAVEQGTVVQFCFRPPKSWGIVRVYLCVWDERADIYREIPMKWAGLVLEQDCDIYTVDFETGDFLGLVWYHFRFERADGSGYFGRSGNTGQGELQDRPVNFQLTIYAGDAPKTAQWYGRGVTYHIFPDRFNRTEIPDPEGMVGGRTVHKGWEDVPDFLPDAKGEIRNRDFFGGSLAGVREKLPYIRSLGVKTIYFSPIFEAASNHRYDTADYCKIDPMFGTQEEFTEFCEEAHALGMRVILDGVFNHTGYDSRYFNGRGTYDELGAYQSKNSKYYDWYDFIDWPNVYSSWWGIYTLPQLNESNKDYMDFIIDNHDSVVRRWLRAGADGWRLDVADELPDAFIERLRAAAREEKDDAVIIGEVWEDASTKIAYDVRRRYTLGYELDGVMNYPLRDSLISYLMGGDASVFMNAQETLRENYPRQFYYSLMNALGTHDTPRILTVLGASPADYELPKFVRAGRRLTTVERDAAMRRLKLGAAVLYTFPGSPCLYYGDEAGLEGYEDPFNRRGYPWGKENQELLAWYTLLGKLRSETEALQDGGIMYHHAEDALLVFERFCKGQRLILCCNRGDGPVSFTVPWAAPYARDLLGQADGLFAAKNGKLRLSIPALTAWLLS